MTRTSKVMIKVQGKSTVIKAMVCKPRLEENPITKKMILCGYIRRDSRHIRVHQVPSVNGNLWVSTWDFGQLVEVPRRARRG